MRGLVTTTNISYRYRMRNLQVGHVVCAASDSLFAGENAERGYQTAVCASVVPYDDRIVAEQSA